MSGAPAWMGWRLLDVERANVRLRELHGFARAIGATRTIPRRRIARSTFEIGMRGAQGTWNLRENYGKRLVLVPSRVNL
jgi:hypothetical protein